MNEENPATPEYEPPAAEEAAAEEATVESTPIEPTSIEPPPASPCGCDKKKLGIVGGAAAAVLLVVVVSIFGCGKSPAKQCLEQVQQFQKNVEAGRADRVFNQLPESYKEDVRDLATGVADKFGEKFFDEATGVAEEAGRFVRKNRKELASMLKDEDVGFERGGESKEPITEDDLELLADLLDGIAAKATYKRLAAGNVEGLLGLGALHKALARVVPALLDKEGVKIESIEIEDEDEKDEPVVLITTVTTYERWDSQTDKFKKVRRTETGAVGFSVEDDGTWFPTWAAEAKDKDERRRAKKYREDWLSTQWKNVFKGLRRDIRNIDSDEIQDVTAALAQLRKDLKKFNDRSGKKGKAALEEFLEELDDDWRYVRRALD